MNRDRGDVDLRNVIDPDRGGCADRGDANRKIGEAAAVQHMIGGKRLDLAGRAIDPDPRTHLEGMTFDTALELLIAVVRQPHRPAREEHRRQGHIERERRVIASAEAAAKMSEIGVDARRLERRARLAEQIGDSIGRLVRRLHAEHEFELSRFRAVPGEPAFRLEEHRIDGLRLELAIEHQQVRIFRRKAGADLLAIGRSLGVGALIVLCERRPDRKRRGLEF